MDRRQGMHWPVNARLPLTIEFLESALLAAQGGGTGFDVLVAPVSGIAMERGKFFPRFGDLVLVAHPHREATLLGQQSGLDLQR